MFAASLADAKPKQAAHRRSFVDDALMTVIVCRRHGAVLAPAHQNTFARELRRALHRYGRGSPVPCVFAQAGHAAFSAPASFEWVDRAGFAVQFPVQIRRGEYCL
jgi:hypothetical protein